MISQHSDIVGKSRAARRVDVDFGFSRGPGGSSSSSGSGAGGNNSGFGSQLSTIPPGLSVGGNNTGGSARGSGGAIIGVASGASAASGLGAGVGGGSNGSYPPSRTTTPALDPESFPTLGSSVQSSNSSSSNSRLPASVTAYHANLPPSDNSPEMLKRRLEERARQYLNYDTSKMAKFQELTSKYKDGQLDSKMVVFEYNRLFDIKPAQLELLIQDLAVLYKNLPSKRNALISAFDDWKSKQAFPALALASSASTSPSFSSSSGLSHSLPGSKTNLSSSWVSANRATPGSIKTSLASSSHFPSLSGATPSAAKPPPVSSSSPGNLSPVSATAKSFSTASLIGSAKVIPRASPSPAAAAKLSDSSFPSLPAAKPKRLPPVRAKTTSTPGPSVWTSGLSATPVDDSPPLSSSTPPPTSNKKKGKGKQVLFRLGAFEN
ncbi:hypothetical protein AWJ20_4932 [Sugiyamaella lignohabitans]|uniref:ZNF598/HEL2 PAH domain-containing protein n=1 Tax=Sugiyamaella lignohabitans TaxID=796027 RepID=A0A167EEM8_9ASCO|nr:uncharacterized protein AWJ20_4932 [Sugiyamaella lignohabitans]ANB13979.1 hypothetical protein AWJ20_4932 [Sugiyamaella lignohabitans]